MKRLIVIWLLITGLLISTAISEVPSLMSYQGILKDSEGQPVEDDVYAIQFRIYNTQTEGVVLWESNGFIPIQTADGLFSHILGSTNPLPDSLSRYTNLWAGITVDLDEEITPRAQLLSVPFSINAQYSDTTGTSLDKTIDASELTEGTLDVERFSAYEDLVAEEKIGVASEQVAPGIHTHTGISFPGTIMRFEDNSVQIINIPSNEYIIVKSITIPAGNVNDYFRFSFTISAENIIDLPLNLTVKINNQDIHSNIYLENNAYRFVQYNCQRLTESEWIIVPCGVSLINLPPNPEITLDIIFFHGGNGSPIATVGDLIVEYDVD